MTVTARSHLPLYRNAIDWERLDREHPPPDVWAEFVFQWPIERVSELQSERFARILDAAWHNSWYANSWRSAGLVPNEVRGLEDIGTLPTFTSDDVREDQTALPPFDALQNWAAPEPGSWVLSD